MAIARQKSAHIWERDELDWYIEPHECSAALFAEEDFDGAIWDPAVGSGRIVESAARAGLRAFGSDIVRRSDLCQDVLDFLKPIKVPCFRNIVSNPPFRSAELFVQKAISITPPNGKVAMLLPLVWMAGFSTKRNWLPSSPLLRILPMSPRPSMPPGAVIEAGLRPGNGTKDFAWFVWEIGYQGEPQLKFLNTKGHKAKRL